MRFRYDFLNGIDGTQSVRDVSHGHQLRFLAEKSFILIKQQFAVVIHGDNAEVRHRFIRILLRSGDSVEAAAQQVGVHVPKELLAALLEHLVRHRDTRPNDGQDTSHRWRAASLAVDLQRQVDRQFTTAIAAAEAALLADPKLHAVGSHKLDLGVSEN